MKTSELSGFFDVKVYRAGVEPKDRTLKGEGESITFNATFAADRLPEGLAKYAKQYTSQRGEVRFAVKFKIGGRVRWFDGQGNQIEKIPNAELDGKKYRVFIDYSELNGNPAKMEPSGYWVNAIMLKEMAENPFEGCVFQPLTGVSPKPQVSERLEEMAHRLAEDLDESFEAHMEAEGKIPF